MPFIKRTRTARQLKEAVAKTNFTTKKEEIMKLFCVSILKNDGQGHRHGSYAKRLLDFDFNLVDKNSSTGRNFVAACAFEQRKILLNSGFYDVLSFVAEGLGVNLNKVTDSSTLSKVFEQAKQNTILYQLNVLMRHELAHALLMHQIRMMNILVSKYGDEGYRHLSMSSSLQEINNVLEDWEVSDRVYIDEKDKEIVANLELNGKILPGLITSKDKKAWENMSLEEMYDKLGVEIAHLQNALSGKLKNDIDENDQAVGRALRTTNMYRRLSNDNKSVIFKKPASDYINGKADAIKNEVIPPFSHIADTIQDVLRDLDEDIVNNSYSKEDLMDIVHKIGDSSILEDVAIISPTAGNVITILYTPEEKMIAIEALKSYAGMIESEYDEWYRKVKERFALLGITDDELADIIKDVKR